MHQISASDAVVLEKRECGDQRQQLQHRCSQEKAFCGIHGMSLQRDVPPAHRYFRYVNNAAHAGRFNVLHGGTGLYEEREYAGATLVPREWHRSDTSM